MDMSIRAIREREGISQMQLATRAGVSLPVISRMETGKPVQSISFRVVCQALGVDPDAVTGVNLYSGLRKAKKHASGD